MPVHAPADASDGEKLSADDEFVEVDVVRGEAHESSARPPAMTAFDLIGSASGLDLSAMFEKGAAVAKHATRFPSTAPAADIVQALCAAAAALGFQVPGSSRNFKVRMEGQSRRGPLVALAQVFEMCPGLHMIEVRKVRGDTIEFCDFYRRLEERCAAVVLQHGTAEGPTRTASGTNLSSSI